MHFSLESQHSRALSSYTNSSIFFLRTVAFFCSVGSPILDLQFVRKRWLKPTHLEENACHESNNISGLAVRLTQGSTSNHDRTQTTGRYCEVLDLGKKLAELISSTGGNQYKRRLENLKDLITIYMSGKEATIVAENDRNNSGVDQEELNTRRGFAAGISDGDDVQEESEAVGSEAVGSGTESEGSSKNEGIGNILGFFLSCLLIYSNSYSSFVFLSRKKLPPV